MTRQDSDHFYLIPTNIAKIRDKGWNPDGFVGIWDSRILAKVAGFRRQIPTTLTGCCRILIPTIFRWWSAA
jgi:hypothetical protein